MALLEQTRTPALERVFNLRDLGGLRTDGGRRTRHGRLFRADGLHRATAGDLDALRTLGLRTVIDLRTEGERDEVGVVAHRELGAQLFHLPVLRQTWKHDDLALAQSADVFLAARYYEMLDEGHEALGRAIHLVASRPRHPLVFHCAAGKDRTGVLAAIILRLVDVPAETVAADYAATAPAIERLNAWLLENDPSYHEAMARQPGNFRQCPPQAMLRFLATVDDEFGSVLGLADHLGVDLDVVNELRAALLV